MTIVLCNNRSGTRSFAGSKLKLLENLHRVIAKLRELSFFSSRVILKRGKGESRVTFQRARNLLHSTGARYRYSSRLFIL